MMRKCVVCEKILDISAFHLHSGRPSGRCKICVAARIRLVKSGKLEPSWADIRVLSAQIYENPWQPKPKKQSFGSVAQKVHEHVLCLFCGKKFWDTSYRDRHLDLMHSSECPAPLSVPPSTL